MRPFLIAMLGALALNSVPAVAAQRTFVASFGSDANPCSITQPCRAFAAAMTNTDPDGEIIVLDTAGYGSVTVDKSVSIIAPPGVYAGISVFAGNGVTISAGASDKVVLRGLTVNGQGGIHGIVINQAAQVEIQRCVVSHMPSIGIYLAPGATKVYVDETRVTSNFVGVYVVAGDLVLTRSQLENNGGDGVFISPGSALTVQAVIRSSLIAGNNFSGVAAIAGAPGEIVQVTVEDTAAVRNGGNGFLASTGSGGQVTFVLSRSVGSRNGDGLEALGPGTTASVSRSTLARNYTFDMKQSSGAVLRSHGNNALSGDGPTNVSGTITQVGLF